MTRRKKPFPFFLWHRRLGLLAFILVVILSVTGIMLNHTEGLKLDESMVESDLLLDWYGINPQGSPVNFESQGFQISQWGEQLFLNQVPLYTHPETLTGIAVLGDIIAVALEQHVLLVDTSGEVIELMPTSTGRIIQAGRNGQRIALLDEEQQYYLSDTELSLFKPAEKTETRWSRSAPLSDTQLEALKQSFRGQGLTLERVILDLHSGRLFHPVWGVLIMDASAVLMILLGLSGLWIWWSRKLKMRSKKHYRKHH